MGNIDELLRKRKKLLDEIDKEIYKNYTKPVTLLFTDIVGSTAYFERMGDIMGRQMIQTHNDLLFPIIKEHGGKIIKTIGDSIMASFDDPHAGVKGAIKMQETLDKYNKGKPENNKINVRMGLHFGKAVVDDKDLFGDMVNTSARVEAKAQAHEIIISSALKAEIKKASFPIVFLGSDFVKGKEEQIDFFIVNWNKRDEKEILASWQGRIKIEVSVGKQKPKGLKLVIKKNCDLHKLASGLPELNKKGNPYLNRVMLPHPKMFFGRKGMIKRITGRITAQRPQSVSIVGERRIGKSSLLKYLNFPTTRIKSEDASKYIYVFIDFQQVRANNANHLIGVIYKELKRQLGDNIEISLKEDLDGIRYLCEKITENGFKFIMFFDEFESVTKNKNIGPDFYSFFRSLANNFPVAFVTASGKNLKDMCATHVISDSPFFNIFAVQHLSIFRENEALELISQPSYECGVPLEALANEIIHEGGCYPFFLQMMCSAWFEFLDGEGLKADEFKGKKIPREVINIFKEEALPHFEYILEIFHKQEIGVFKQIIQDKQPDPDSLYVEQLEKKGYLIRGEDDSFKPFSNQFAVFLKRRLSSAG